jgi:hypothetical protein
LRIEKAGTFQALNDVIADLTRWCYIDNATRKRSIRISSAKSSQFCGIELSLREILSRIPGLEQLYRSTFGEEAQTERISFNNVFGEDSLFEIRIDDRELFTDRESLKQIVSRWRSRFAFLKNWRLMSAAHWWGNSVIIFHNNPTEGIDEFSEANLTYERGQFEASTQTDDLFPPEKGLCPAADFSGSNYAISAVGDCYLSEFSFHYLALFLLSSLVRYRPDTWIHAISRSVMPDIPADDQSLSLIGRFLDLNSGSIPATVVAVLNPHLDEYA